MQLENLQAEKGERRAKGLKNLKKENQKEEQNKRNIIYFCSTFLKVDIYMCYSVESSLKTSGFSLVAIIYLISSGIPKFQYLGVVLIGWCIMQFAEALLWMTDPRKCTLTNKLLTIFLIPVVLLLQPLASAWGSLYITPWKENKDFIINFTIIVTVGSLFFRYVFVPYMYESKFCTIITPSGHLDWRTNKRDFSFGNPYALLYNTFWLFLCLYPLFKFWKGDRLWPFCIIPIVGFIYSFSTDAPDSIWCNITSYSSYSGIIILFLYKHGIKIID
jgi:hypothetical protein